MAVILAAGSSPFFSSWHEAMVQHVRCSEHGELTHFNGLHTHHATSGRVLAVQSEDSPAPSDDHRHCDVAFVVQGVGCGPIVRTVVRFTPPDAPTAIVAREAPRPGRAFVLASAPKTSPPAPA